jgi:hypothetical protein
MARTQPARRNFWPFDEGQPLGSRTTIRRVRSGSRATTSARHKGFWIYKRADGNFEVPALDRDSYFDTARDAKRFIDDTVKHMRKNPGASILDLLSLAQLTGALGGTTRKKRPAGKKKARRKNPGWIKAKAIRVRRHRGKVLLDIFR